VERNGNIMDSNGLLLESDTLLGAWFMAQPEGWENPFRLEINLSGYIKKKKDGTITAFWKKENQPSQIAKVVESQGLRTLWPDEFQQLYTPEEIGEADMFETTAKVVKQEPDRKSRKEDIYKTQDVEEPEKPTEKETKKEPAEKEGEEEPAKDPVRKLYLGEDLKGLTKIKFKKFLNSHTKEIPTMGPEYQKEIQAEHQRLFPGQSFPILMPGDTPSEDTNYTELSLEEREANILKFVEGSERDDMRDILVPCPNRQDVTIKYSICDICMYKTREGCPTWSAYDTAFKEE